MPIDIVIPSLGESITTGVVASWLKNDGDFVDRDESVLDLETDKITMPIPAPASGVLKHRAKVGDVVPVGGIVGTLDDSAAGSRTPAQTARAEKNGTAAPAKEAATAGARAGAAPGAAAIGSGPPQADADARATPLARKLAQEHGVALSRVTGTGPAGRIREQDVQALVKGGGAASAAPAPATAGPPPAREGRGVRRERMTPLRQRVASRLVEAQHNAAMLTTFNECDMTAVMDLRKQHKEAFEKRHGIGLGFMSFFVKAAVSALQQFPAVNASMVSDAAGGPEVEYHDFCNISVAIGTPKGLVVPVVRDCQSLTFAQIELAIKDLAARAREGKLTLGDLQGGTFTITNGGIYGSLMSTPILNPPQTGILGMHAIKNRPVEDPGNPGQATIRPMMYLALSYDHRLIDGSEAVQFLVAIKDAIEGPQRLLLGL
jgi:2-oxoglutarate dehydrogenase E2 component (dihydrolipoamide succinyltransferase)